MTESHSPDPSARVTRLDQVLDELASTGKSPGSRDPALSEMALLAQAIHDDDGIEWPEEMFPQRMAKDLYAQLGFASRRTPPNAPPTSRLWDGREASQPPSDILTIPADDIAILTQDARSWVDRRRVLQMAVGIAGFALLAVVLIAVFRGFEEETPAAVGGTGDSHPQQLAVTMQADPINGNPDIFLVSLDGSKPVNLTSNPASDTVPAWSPDGRKIAFISDRSGVDALYVMGHDGRNIREVYAPESGEAWILRHPAWSPDGLTLALMQFSRTDATDTGRLVIIDSGGLGIRVVTPHPDYPDFRFDRSPAWSPNGQWLAVDVSGSDETMVALIGLSSYTVQPLTSGSVPAWLPDGRLSFVSDDRIVVAALADGEPAISSQTELTFAEPSTIDSLDWSADGSNVAFTSPSLGSGSIWIAHAAGGESVEIPGSVTGLYPTWSPNGSMIAFLRAGVFSSDGSGYELVIVNATDFSVTSETDTGIGGLIASHAQWRPEGSSADETPSPAPTLAQLPTPTDASQPTEAPDEQLTPPSARLHVGSAGIDGELGSYSWQFTGADQSRRSVVHQHIPGPGVFGATRVDMAKTASISIHGEEYTQPPITTSIDIYEYIVDRVDQPDLPSANPGTLTYTVTMGDEPVRTYTAEDPAAPEFELDLPRGQYAIFVTSEWAQSPDQVGEIFVTWIFEATIGNLQFPPAGSELLWPPSASLHADSTTVAGYLGSYQWQFEDPLKHFGAADVPVVELTEDPVAITSGDELDLKFSGEEYRHSPNDVRFDLYPYEPNRASPNEIRGIPVGEPAFAIQTLPILTTTADDPEAPMISLVEDEGHYVLVVRADWGIEPISGREIYVTWVFDLLRENPGRGEG